MSRDLGVITGLDALLHSVGGVAGKVVIDIGSGEGTLERQLAELGAEVTGVDPLGPQQDWTEAGSGRYRMLRQGAETLPWPDKSVDAVLFVFSLHHIPDAVLPGILAEAKRVLKETGSLYVAEPLAEGPVQEVAELYHDETAVRHQAAATLAAHAPALFGQHEQIFYRNRRVYSGYEDYATKVAATMRFNDFTEAQLRAPAVQERFEAVHGRLGGVFDQPVRIDLLRP